MSELAVKSLDDGVLYTVGTTGLAETGDAPVYSGRVSGCGVGARQESSSAGEEQKDQNHHHHQRSSKLRVKQRLRESVGLKARTKDVALEAARLRQNVHVQRITKLAEVIEERDSLLRKLSACESDLATRLEELAAASPLEPSAGALVRELERRKRRLEAVVLPEHTSALIAICQRWRDALAKSDKVTRRDQESARLQLDHYDEKAAALRKAKVKRDLALLEKAATETARADPGQKVSVSANHAADDKYHRNEAKLKAAQDDYEKTTASAIRVYDAAVVERWNDLAPLVGQLWGFEAALATLHAREAENNLKACAAGLQSLPPVAPLHSRLLAAKAGRPTRATQEGTLPVAIEAPAPVAALCAAAEEHGGPEEEEEVVVVEEEEEEEEEEGVDSPPPKDESSEGEPSPPPKKKPPPPPKKAKTPPPPPPKLLD